MQFIFYLLAAATCTQAVSMNRRETEAPAMAGEKATTMSAGAAKARLWADNVMMAIDSKSAELSVASTAQVDAWITSFAQMNSPLTVEMIKDVAEVGADLMKAAGMGSSVAFAAFEKVGTGAEGMKEEGMAAGAMKEGMKEGMAAGTMKEGMKEGMAGEGMAAGTMKEGMKEGMAGESMAGGAMKEGMAGEGMAAGTTNEGMAAGAMKEGMKEGGMAAETMKEGMAAGTMKEGMKEGTVGAAMPKAAVPSSLAQSGAGVMAASILGFATTFLVM
ncbi:hypothetical protein HDU98_003358 [Podochytrium sp. JEL0797]|nr:hypothetical protein HDU98_003358 [Podochytrium sp. JEL0797]